MCDFRPGNWAAPGWAVLSGDLGEALEDAFSLQTEKPRSLRISVPENCPQKPGGGGWLLPHKTCSGLFFHVGDRDGGESLRGGRRYLRLELQRLRANPAAEFRVVVRLRKRWEGDPALIRLL